MVLDGELGTDDDYLEALRAGGSIVSSLEVLKENGLKIGIIGMMGPTAEEDAPLAGPVYFDHYIQSLPGT